MSMPIDGWFKIVVTMLQFLIDMFKRPRVIILSALVKWAELVHSLNVHSTDIRPSRLPNGRSEHTSIMFHSSLVVMSLPQVGGAFCLLGKILQSHWLLVVTCDVVKSGHLICEGAHRVVGFVISDADFVR